MLEPHPRHPLARGGWGLGKSLPGRPSQPRSRPKRHHRGTSRSPHVSKRVENRQLAQLCVGAALTALELIACYGYRFKIEVAFKQALHTLGTYAYHFWMMTMTPISRRSGNQYLHRKPKHYRDQVCRKLAAYHRYVQLGCIAQGLLQYLALYFRRDVWAHFRSWLRTMNPAQPPSEAVVAQALRNMLPEFLLDNPDEHNFKKFILDRTDFERCPPLQLAA
jgi:hypothetical protein